jgi:hypothetical protein
LQAAQLPLHALEAQDKRVLVLFPVKTVHRGFLSARAISDQKPDVP